MQVSELLNVLVDIADTGKTTSADVQLRGAHSDSRLVGPGDLFIALPGVRSQGTDYLEKAFARGCSVALVPETGDVPREYVDRCIRVGRIRHNGARAAAAIYGHPTEKLLTFGVTGTNGKTSTCHILKHILESCGHRVVMLTTVAHEFEGWRQETPNTTPDAALLQSTLASALSKGATAAVIEVSAHGILLDRVLGCRFDGLVFTNLTTDHQDFFDGNEPYFAEKLRLFVDDTYHKENCVAVVGNNDTYGERILQQRVIPSVSFGDSFGDGVGNENSAGASHITTSNLQVTAAGLRGSISVEGTEFSVQTSLTSAFNRLNIAAAAGLAKLAGLPDQKIAEALQQPIVVPGRLMRVDSAAPFQVIVDFAHTDSAMSNLLLGLRKECGGKLIVVFGAGGDKDPARRFTLPQVVIELADVGIITLDNPRSESPQAIIDSMVENWLSLARKSTNPALHHVQPDRPEAIALALSLAEAGDVVVLAGKGHETTQIFADRIDHHDDQAIARDWLSKHYRA